MRPRDLTKGNWDINYAVFVVPGFEAQVTADSTRMWFRFSTPRAFADFAIPIREFKKAVDFIKTVRVKDLHPGPPEAGKRLGTHGIELIGWIGKFKAGKIAYSKYPWTVHILPLSSRTWSRSISIRLSVFRKLARWYETDFA